MLIAIITTIISIAFLYYIYTKEETIFISEDEVIENNTVQTIEENNEKKEKEESEKIVVHISGAVNKEGVFELEENSRISDAINKAEGLKDNADTKHINLAFKLEDGMKIYIPTIEENLDKNVQKYVLENKISQGHAKVLVALPKEQQNIIANSIIGQKLSVHDTENLIRKLKEGQLQDKKIPSLAQNRISPHSKEQLEKICKAIQKQNLNIKLQKNKIIVEFSNDEEVERFSKILPNISF